MRRERVSHTPRPSRASIVLASATALVLLVGAWGIAARPGSPTSHDPTRLEVPGGVLTVSQVWPEVMAHAMSGMAVPDEVPPGHRRVALEVTVEALDDGPLRYRAQDLRLEGTGMRPVRATRAQPDEAAIPAGAALAARLVFDVPVDAADLALRTEDSAGRLEIGETIQHEDDGIPGAAHEDEP